MANSRKSKKQPTNNTSGNILKYESLVSDAKSYFKEQFNVDAPGFDIILDGREFSDFDSGFINTSKRAMVFPERSSWILPLQSAYNVAGSYFVDKNMMFPYILDIAKTDVESSNEMRDQLKKAYFGFCTFFASEFGRYLDNQSGNRQFQEYLDSKFNAFEASEKTKQSYALIGAMKYIQIKEKDADWRTTIPSIVRDSQDDSHLDDILRSLRK